MLTSHLPLLLIFYLSIYLISTLLLPHAPAPLALIPLLSLAHPPLNHLLPRLLARTRLKMFTLSSPSLPLRDPTVHNVASIMLQFTQALCLFFALYSTHPAHVLLIATALNLPAQPLSGLALLLLLLPSLSSVSDLAAFFAAVFASAPLLPLAPLPVWPSTGLLALTLVTGLLALPLRTLGLSMLLLPLASLPRSAAPPPLLRTAALLPFLPWRPAFFAAWVTLVLQARRRPAAPLLPLDKGRRSLLQSLTASPNSRRIFYFLCLTLGFMFVELGVGLFSGSLGLVSDAGHMFFDSASLFIGLYAAHASSWRKDAIFSFGYARYETIAGLVNGLFLTFVAAIVLLESLERLFNPPEIRTSGLLITSVLGLCINLVGVFFFHDVGHAHSGSDCDQHGHSHGNDNMRGVYLHVLADALGSVGVITSSLLIQWKGWWVADPICSLCIASLILVSVRPLLRSTFDSLMLATPREQAPAFARLCDQVLTRPDVAQLPSAHLWAQSSSHLVGSMRVLLHKGSTERDALAAWLKNALVTELGCAEVCVEVGFLD